MTKATTTAEANQKSPIIAGHLDYTKWFPRGKKARTIFAPHLRHTGVLGWRGHRVGGQADGGRQHQDMVIEHYYRFIPNLTRQDGSAFDKAAAVVGL